MNIKEEISKLKDLQNWTGGYTEVAIQNIQMAPFLFIQHLERADLLIADDEIRIHLIPKKGVLSWFYRKVFKREINRNLHILGKYIYFWVPKGPKMPVINFYWGPIPDEHQ